MHTKLYKFFSFFFFFRTNGNMLNLNKTFYPKLVPQKCQEKLQTKSQRTSKLIKVFKVGEILHSLVLIEL